MLLIWYFLFSALFPLNCGVINEKLNKKNGGKGLKLDYFFKEPFADVPNFETKIIYSETYSPDGVAHQLLQNFFNWCRFHQHLTSNFFLTENFEHKVLVGPCVPS